MFGGAGANTLAQGAFDYAECRTDYRDSLHRLQKEKVDVFIGNHTWNNDTFRKAKLLRETGENHFLDPQLWHQFLTFCEKRLDAAIAKDK
jgi:ribosomal protein S4